MGTCFLDFQFELLCFGQCAPLEPNSCGLFAQYSVQTFSHATYSNVVVLVAEEEGAAPQVSELPALGSRGFARKLGGADVSCLELGGGWWARAGPDGRADVGMRAALRPRMGKEVDSINSQRYHMRQKTFQSSVDDPPVQEPV